MSVDGQLSSDIGLLIQIDSNLSEDFLRATNLQYCS